MKKTLLSLFVLLMLPGLALAQSDMAADQEAIRAAVLDYVEAIYNVEPDRIKRSVHPNLAKYGYWMPRDGNDYQGSAMTFDQLVDLAGKWNQSGRVNADEAPKEIEIYDVMDKTAVAKLSAQWGVDHMQLA
ncbi:MAG TPA: nuclear transport factor 2 family protein, partial [Rhodothermales bacterium]|nr:nuclear transport factor 2 family protein [Rhodothermales bacterium]